MTKYFLIIINIIIKKENMCIFNNLFQKYNEHIEPSELSLMNFSSLYPQLQQNQFSSFSKSLVRK